jgi:hypothetical protein
MSAFPAFRDTGTGSFGTCELLNIWRLSATSCPSSKGWGLEPFQQRLEDEMHQPLEEQFCGFRRMRTAVQYAAIVVLLSTLFWPKRRKN